MKKIFISYAWGSINKKDLTELKNMLIENDFEVIIDIDRVEVGDELNEFMEKSLNESDFVILLCTPNYKDRADKRIGGVGYETNILSEYKKKRTKKIIPIICEGNIDVSQPVYLGSVYCLNFIDKEVEIKYNELLVALGKKIFSQEFNDFLENTEILSNSHGSKKVLKIDDIFVYPELYKLEESIEEEQQKLILDSKSIYDELIKSKHLLISGDNLSGKTTLSKKIMKDLLEKELIPIYLTKEEISNNLENSLRKAIERQYLGYNYCLEDIEKYVLIVDDFHLFKDKERKKILEKLLKYKIILFVDDIFIVNYINKINFSKEIKKFKIKKFGPKLRKELVKNWSDLYDDASNSNIKKYKKNDERIELLEITIGKVFKNGIMPSYPFFLLSVLVITEVNINLDPSITSQGHCYHALIFVTLTKNGVKTEDIDAYLNLLSELSYYLFKNGKLGLYNKDIEDFFDKYKKEFNIKYEKEIIFGILKKAQILREDDLGQTLFRYPYIYFYFLGKFFTEHYEEKTSEITEIIENLHVDRNAYILIFISHHSKEKKIFDKILVNSEALFNSYSEITLNNEEINKFKIEFKDLIEKFLPKVKEIKKEKEKILKLQEREENLENNEEKLYVEDEEEMNIVDESEKNIRRSFRTVEVIGIIAKNRHGSLKKILLKNMLINAINVNLRILGFIFSDVSELQELIKEYIEKEQKRFRDMNEREIIKRMLEKLLGILIFQITTIFIQKTIQDIGSENLVGLIDEITEEKKTPIISLIKLGIKLWYCKEVKIQEIQSEIKEYGYSSFSIDIMKYLIIEHCANHDIGYKERQKISNKLKISKELLFE
jgi:hypothetical protein